MNWKATVYMPSKRDKQEEKEWQVLRNQLIREAGYVCRACRKRKGVKVLTVHHILPRSRGGTDLTDNLIVLCVECHDKVEEDIKRFPTRSDIERAFVRRDSIRERGHKPEKVEYGTKWQQWVYGGKRNPNLS